LSLSSLPPPPHPTLFPYTTLFRSLRDARFSGSIVISTYASPSSRARSSINRSADVAYPSPVFQGTTAYPICPSTCEGRDEEDGTDRKSTRLNSSHVAISYAVFCLK